VRVEVSLCRAQPATEILTMRRQITRLITRRLGTNADGVAQHYKQTAPTAYRSLNFMTGNVAYEANVHTEILRHFGFDGSAPGQTPVVVADLGAGTGQSGAKILASLKNMLKYKHAKLLCVEPFPEMISKEAIAEVLHQDHHKDIEFIVGKDAVAFTSSPEYRYTHILLKGCVHHMTPSLSTVFRGIRQQLAPGGRMLIVTRPVETDYPWFERLKSIWRTTQPPIKVLEEAAIAAGLVSVETTVVDYQFTISLPELAGWIRSRVWSEFSMLTDAEMEQGIKELEKKYSGTAVKITFVDRLLFMTAQT